MKIKQAAFPLDAPLFTSAELAEVSGLARSMVDVWVSRGLLEPTRREQSPRRTKGRVRKGHGRPMFSAIAIFKVRLACELGRHLGIGLSEWVPFGNDMAKALEAASDTTKITDLVAGGNWMWAVARGIENGKPFKISGYATQVKGKWVFDPRLGSERSDPSFGLDVPHLFIPMSSIFAMVYGDGKKLLGITDKSTTYEGV
jgi:hypothetical protein